MEHDDQPTPYDENEATWLDDGGRHDARKTVPHENVNVTNPRPRPYPARTMPQGDWDAKALQYERMAEQVDAADYDRGDGSTMIALSTHYLVLASLCRMKL